MVIKGLKTTVLVNPRLVVVDEIVRANQESNIGVKLEFEHTVKKVLSKLRSWFNLLPKPDEGQMVVDLWISSLDLLVDRVRLVLLLYISNEAHKCNCDHENNHAIIFDDYSNSLGVSIR